MSVIAHDGKVVVAGGKSLSFDNLISMANETTGQSDTTLTDAVQSLISGFGGSVMPAPEGYKLVTNEFDFTPAVDSNPDIVLNHGLGVKPAYIVCSLNDVDSILNNGKSTFVAGFYYSGSGYASDMNTNWGLSNGEIDVCFGGYYKRYSLKTLLKEQGTSFGYYIRNVNDTSFNLGYDNAYTWVAGAEIHVACFGFKKVVA